MFFDNASTTIVDNSIMQTIYTINNNSYYNPGALYRGGRDVSKIISDVRNSIKKSLNFDGDVIFTGSATEANNMAIFGCANRRYKKVLLSEGEHPSVYNSMMELKLRGFDVEFVKLTKNGCVDEGDFIEKMTPDVGLVSIMYVSNETGAINNISALVGIAKKINKNVVFHCDGVQAVGKVLVDISSLGVDLFTLSAHKIHGLKGVGALLVRKGCKVKPLIFGGGQEGGLRSGTENVFGIVSLGMAVDNACKSLTENYDHVKMLKDKFVEKISSSNVDYQIFSPNDASAYIVSVGFKNCRAETLLNMLSDRGIYVGNGSACSAKKSGNRVLQAMGCSKEYVEGNLRFSFSKFNTIDEVVSLADNVVSVVNEYMYNASM